MNQTDWLQFCTTEEAGSYDDWPYYQRRIAIESALLILRKLNDGSLEMPEYED